MILQETLMLLVTLVCFAFGCWGVIELMRDGRNEWERK